MLLVESGTSAKIKNQCVYAELVALVWRDMLVHEANCAARPRLNFEEEEHLRQRMGTSCHVAWARVAVAEQGGRHDDVDSTRRLQLEEAGKSGRMSQVNRLDKANNRC